MHLFAAVGGEDYTIVQNWVEKNAESFAILYESQLAWRLMRQVLGTYNCPVLTATSYRYSRVRWSREEGLINFVCSSRPGRINTHRGGRLDSSLILAIYEHDLAKKGRRNGFQRLSSSHGSPQWTISHFVSAANDMQSVVELDPPAGG